VFIELAAFSLGLSACRIVVDTAVNRDGSGELRTAVVYSAEEKQGSAQTPGNESKSICDNLKENAPPEATFTEEEQDGETYCVTAHPFTSLGELRTLYSRMSNVTVRTLQIELGRFVFDVDVDLTADDQGEPVANEWRLTVPGSLGEHNADQVEGQTLIWEISPGEKANLRAESDVGLGLTTLGNIGASIVALACALAVAAGAGVVYLMRWRR